MFETMLGLAVRNYRKERVLAEMIDHCLSGRSGNFRKSVYKECLKRESVATTVVEKGLAFPHAKMPDPMPPQICIGYSGKGVEWDSSGEIVHIIVLLICHEDDHLSLLAELATLMQGPGVQEKLAAAEDPEQIIKILRAAREFRLLTSPHKKEELTRTLIRQLVPLLNDSPRSRTLLFTNTPSRVIKLLKEPFPQLISLVTNRKDLADQLFSHRSRIADVFITEDNLSEEQSILRGLWNSGSLHDGEILICISGFDYDDMPHSISITSVPWDLYNENRILSYKIPHKVNLEILERVIYLAIELSRQGREGKPVGTIFVVGEYEKVKPYCKQLIINPFGGLPEQNRSILDPSLSETIKEYSKIDGAFIIGNDGQIHSAGTYLSIPPDRLELPSGLGARHAAARGITLVAPVVTAVISESTGIIRIFWDGVEQDKYG